MAPLTLQVTSVADGNRPWLYTCAHSHSNESGATVNAAMIGEPPTAATAKPAGIVSNMLPTTSVTLTGGETKGIEPTRSQCEWYCNVEKGNAIARNNAKETTRDPCRRNNLTAASYGTERKVCGTRQAAGLAPGGSERRF